MARKANKNKIVEEEKVIIIPVTHEKPDQVEDTFVVDESMQVAFDIIKDSFTKIKEVGNKFNKPIIESFTNKKEE